MAHLSRNNSPPRAPLVSETPMSRPKKLPREMTAELRHLAHDLSNALETIIQASYLLGQTRLDSNGKRWARMIESAVDDAARITRSTPEILRKPQGNANDKASH